MKSAEILLLMAFFRLSSPPAAAQNQVVSDLAKLELELVSVCNSILSSGNDEERMSRSLTLAGELSDVLEIKGSMDYPFDSLKALSDLQSQGSEFRVFSWEIGLSNGTVTYAGVVAMKAGDEIKTFVLSDSSSSRSNAEFATLKPESWFGALYYGLKEYEFRNVKYFILLGINRSEEFSKRRIIEVVEFAEPLRFGAEIFDYKKKVGIKRMIYRHSNETEMSLWFEEGTSSIVMDHLAPVDPAYEGKQEYYAPDFSFDALHWKKGKLKYDDDYDARMSPNIKERFYEMELPEEKKVY